MATTRKTVPLAGIQFQKLCKLTITEFTHTYEYNYASVSNLACIEKGFILRVPIFWVLIPCSVVTNILKVYSFHLQDRIPVNIKTAFSYKMVTSAYKNKRLYNPENRNANRYSLESPKSNTGAPISGFIKGICHDEQDQVLAARGSVPLSSIGSVGNHVFSAFPISFRLYAHALNC
jgi:hypothetical protein